MASAGAILKLSLFLLICFTILFPSSLGKREFYNYQHKYPFIKKASSFSTSSSSSSFSSNHGSGSGSDSNSDYDYIIVGGGTAGCPLATTLSRKFRVLVLERGGVPFTNANVTFLGNFHMGLADTSPSSPSQAFASTDGVINARARVLGGGSSINAGFYSRASPRFVEKMGWDPEAVMEAYKWVEAQIVNRPGPKIWQRALKEGLLNIGVKPFNGFTYDHVYGTKIGGTIFDRFGRRHSAAELLSRADPRRLTVLIYATVQNILFDTSGKTPEAVGVTFKDENGREHRVNLSDEPGSELILSSGAIGTPHLLMLSGIGPKLELEKFNISAVLHNEHVGKGIADNPLNTIFVPSKRPFEQSLIQTVGITKKGVYIEASSGFGQSQDSIRCCHGILSGETGQLSTIPPMKKTPKMIKAYLVRKKALPYEAFNGGFILEKVADPISAGYVSLITADINDNPSVTFNYFSHPRDLRRCVTGVRLAARIALSERFLNYTQCEKETVEKLLSLSVKANVNLVPKTLNDTKSLEQFCKDTVATIWHYHGGCHVGKVVNADFRVLGIQRLRIVDGSTFNESPGTNPQATVMMMGRYMGIEILRERLRKKAGI